MGLHTAEQVSAASARQLAVQATALSVVLSKELEEEQRAQVLVTASFLDFFGVTPELAVLSCSYSRRRR